MAATAPFTLGDAVLRLTASTESLNKKLGDAERMTKRRFGNIQKLAGKLGRGMAIAGAAMVLPLASFTKKAMEAVESENLFSVALGKNADAVRAWSEDLRESLGLNAFEIRKNVGIFNAMFGSMGLGEESALDMAKSLTVLSEDMASFFNLKPEEAFQKLQAGITGESEPLKRLGILVNETTTKVFAMANGIGTASTATDTQRRKIKLANITLRQGALALEKSKKSTAEKTLALQKLNLKYQNSIDAASKFKIELTEQDKVLARHGLIMQQTSIVQGDLERTQDSATNQMRRLKNEYDNMAIEIGMVFIPALKNVLKGLIPLVKKIGEWAKANPELIETIGKVALALAIGGPLLIGFNAVAGAVSTLVGLVGGAAIAGTLLFVLVALAGTLDMIFGSDGLIHGGLGRNVISDLVDKLGSLGEWIDKYYDRLLKIITFGQAGKGADVGTTREQQLRDFAEFQAAHPGQKLKGEDPLDQQARQLINSMSGGGGSVVNNSPTTNNFNMPLTLNAGGDVTEELARRFGLMFIDTVKAGMA